MAIPLAQVMDAYCLDDFDNVRVYMLVWICKIIIKS